jgi:2-polyprenyl-6-methoxyphenol hydroxylase-like FAD-dependent oxidoreductase
MKNYLPNRDVKPVIVVGAGPTGLVLAIHLQMRSVPYRLFEKLETPMTFSKANTLNSRTLEGLDRLGISQAVLSKGLSLPKGAFHRSGHQLAEFSADVSDYTPMPFLVNLRQNELEQILRQRLAELGGTVETGWELLDFEQHQQGVTTSFKHAKGDTLSIEGAYLVGTDGAHSRVRRGLGLPLDGITYPDAFVVTDVHTDFPEQLYATDTNHVWLHDDGFLLGWPYREKNYWHFVFNLTEAQASACVSGQVQLEQLQTWIRERVGDPNLKVHNPTWISKFRIHKRQVTRYRIDRVILIGDAAHLHSPMAGKGLGNSSQEALNLGWKLAAVMHGTAKPDLLDTVEVERIPVLRAVAQESEISHLLFTASNPIYGFVRDHLVWRLIGHKALFEAVGVNNAQLNIHHRKSRLSEQHAAHPNKAWKAGPQAGDRAPEARLETSLGAKTSVFDATRHPEWALLVFNDDFGRTQLENLERVVKLYRSNIRLHTIGRNGSLRDVHGEAAKRYRSDGAQLYLIRPDGYIGFRAQTLESHALQQYLTKILLPDASSHIMTTNQVLPEAAA